jgi:hypothetical protein
LALILAHVALILLDILDGLELDSLPRIYADVRASVGANPANVLDCRTIYRDAPPARLQLSLIRAYPR